MMAVSLGFLKRKKGGLSGSKIRELTASNTEDYHSYNLTGRDFLQ